jgi:hypothetical protein
MSIPSLVYSCEIRTLKQKDIKRLKTEEMKFIKRTAGYNLLDHRGNEGILEELKVGPIENK